MAGVAAIHRKRMVKSRQATRLWEALRGRCSCTRRQQSIKTSRAAAAIAVAQRRRPAGPAHLNGDASCPRGRPGLPLPRPRGGGALEPSRLLRSRALSMCPTYKWMTSIMICPLKELQLGHASPGTWPVAAGHAGGWPGVMSARHTKATRQWRQRRWRRAHLLTHAGPGAPLGKGV